MAQGGEREVELFVPGRICLFGEHSDWAGSYRRQSNAIPVGACLVSGTNQGLRARARKHAHSLVVHASSHTGERHGPFEVPMEPGALLAVAHSGSYWSYAAGVAYVVLERFAVGGLVVDNYETTLPAEKGLSSSAAVCVLLARAFSECYGLRLSVRGEMELAFLGERTTPSQCGRMDQCCAFGVKPVLMEFDGEYVSSRPLHLGGPLHLVIVNLRARKDTVKILHDLNGCYPVADTPAKAKVHWLLGDYNRTVIARAISLLEAGDAPALGLLMAEAQAEFDRCAAPVCPSELTSPVLHRVLAHAPLAPHVYGGKGVGSQGDGCAQLLARSRDDAQAVLAILHADFGMDCITLSLGEDGSALPNVTAATGVTVDSEEQVLHEPVLARALADQQCTVRDSCVDAVANNTALRSQRTSESEWARGALAGAFASACACALLALGIGVARRGKL